MNQKVQQQGLLQYSYIAFAHTQEVEIGSFMKAKIRIRSQTSGPDQKVPDPTGSGSGSATIIITM
jgi:hypothetical protein